MQVFVIFLVVLGVGVSAVELLVLKGRHVVLVRNEGLVGADRLLTVRVVLNEVALKQVLNSVVRHSELRECWTSMYQRLLIGSCVAIEKNVENVEVICVAKIVLK